MRLQPRKCFTFQSSKTNGYKDALGEVCKFFGRAFLGYTSQIVSRVLYKYQLLPSPLSTVAAKQQETLCFGSMPSG